MFDITIYVKGHLPFFRLLFVLALVYVYLVPR